MLALHVIYVMGFYLFVQISVNFTMPMDSFASPFITRTATCQVTHVTV